MCVCVLVCMFVCACVVLKLFPWQRGGEGEKVPSGIIRYHHVCDIIGLARTVNIHRI